MKKCAIYIYILFISALNIFSQDPEFQTKLEELYKNAEAFNIPKEWLKENLENSKFEIYYSIPKLFTNMAENRVKKSDLTFEEYLRNFGVDDKVKNGLLFIEEHKEILTVIENRNGIHNELIVALLAIETNFGNKKFFGNFFLFPSLVSQYLLMPKKEEFALRELSYLYLLKKEKNIDYSYIKGSFAGAVGLGQFIPSFVYNFFIDSNLIDSDTDVFSLDDNIASIENYLSKHGLNYDTINDDKSIYEAVFAYNRSDAYVKAVVYIYKELYKNRNK
ncbi:MAG TPA: lytic murein transglycosylase [Spirochaetota bacterium]|mgnify:CR=1 FL=1|nr:lytic murein transglycosylase [Spirochaetota bacterium]